MTLLGKSSMAAVLRADDLERARRFYGGLLGLKEEWVSDTGGEASFTSEDGGRLLVYERPGMPAPQNTTLGFTVPADKFVEAIAELRDKGVAFEDYDLPEIDLRTVDGVAEQDGMKVAWFKDSEGNIISVGSF